MTFIIGNIQSLQFLNITRNIKSDVSWKDIAAVTYITSMYNNILPVGGAVAIRATLLKKIVGIAWSQVTALMGIYYMLSYLAMSILLLFIAAIAYVQQSIELEIFIFSMLICMGMIIAILIFFMFPFKIPLRFRLATFSNRLFDTITLYKYKFRDHFKIGSQQLIIIFLTGVRLYLSFVFLDVSIDFWKLLFIQTFISFSLVFSLTPGNLGIKEGLIVLFAGFLDINEDIAIVGSLVDRGAGLLTVLMMGSIGKIWLFIKYR